MKYIIDVTIVDKVKNIVVQKMHYDINKDSSVTISEVKTEFLQWVNIPSNTFLDNESIKVKGKKCNDDFVVEDMTKVYYKAYLTEIPKEKSNK